MKKNLYQKTFRGIFLLALLLLFLLITFFSFNSSYFLGSNLVKKQGANALFKEFLYYLIPPKQEIVAYLPYWVNIDFNKIPLEKISYIQLAFFGIQSDYTLSYGLNNNNYQLKNKLSKLTDLQKKNPNLKIIISIGSTELDYTIFANMIMYPDYRLIFIKDIINFVKIHNINGVNIDWEYPKSLQDRSNFTIFISELRSALNTLYASTKIDYYISVSCLVSQGSDKMYDFSGLSKYVNAIEIMSYDLVGKWSTKTGHHSNLYKNHLDKWSIDDGVSLLLANGVSSNKILIGVPFYGIEFSNVDSFNNGLYQDSDTQSEVKYLSYDYIYTYLLNDPAYRSFFTSNNNAQYLFNEEKKKFITYQGHKSLDVIATYIKNNRLKGAMIWHIGQDSSKDSLLNSLIDMLK